MRGPMRGNFSYHRAPPSLSKPGFFWAAAHARGAARPLQGC